MGTDLTTMRALRIVRSLIDFEDLQQVGEAVLTYYCWCYVDLKRKFAQLLKDHSPEPRSFYCHLTSVTVSSNHTARVLCYLEYS